MAAARAAWRAEAAGLDPSRLVFLDESGFDIRLVRTHARAPRGRRAHGKAPGGHGFGRLQGAPQPASDDAPKGDGHLPCSRWRGPHGATTEYAAALCGPEQGLSD